MCVAPTRSRLRDGERVGITPELFGDEPSDDGCRRESSERHEANGVVPTGVRRLAESIAELSLCGEVGTTSAGLLDARNSVPLPSEATFGLGCCCCDVALVAAAIGVGDDTGDSSAGAAAPCAGVAMAPGAFFSPTRPGARIALSGGTVCGALRRSTALAATAGSATAGMLVTPGRRTSACDGWRASGGGPGEPVGGATTMLGTSGGDGDFSSAVRTAAARPLLGAAGDAPLR